MPAAIFIRHIGLGLGPVKDRPPHLLADSHLPLLLIFLPLKHPVVPFIWLRLVLISSIRVFL